MLSRLLALLLLVLALPVTALLSLMVLISIGGPVVFRQVRSGKGGTEFVLLKLRSMSDLRDGDGVLLPDAERISPFGGFLRRTKLDELLGLFNIFLGDMNFVGPRPLLPGTIKEKGEAGHRRGAIKPGLTGWAQVNGNTLLTDEEKFALDLWYIENRSIWIDLQIIVLTFVVMMGGERRRAIALQKGRD